MDVPCDPDHDNAHIANSSVVVLKLDPLLFGDVLCDPDYDNAHIANSSVVVLKLDRLLFGEEFVMDPNADLLVPADRCGGADGHPSQYGP